MANPQENYENELSIESKIEALLFIAPAPTGLSQIAEALNVSLKTIEKGVESLQEQLRTRGIRIQENKGKYQLTTAPELSLHVEEFLHLENTARLSSAALETLAIVAYQQPITRPSVDSIRGVNSDSVIRNLLSKGLIEEAGRSDGPGRPILYSTSPEFLQYFGLSSIKELPPIDIKLQINSNDTNKPTQPSLPIGTVLLKE